MQIVLTQQIDLERMDVFPTLSFLVHERSQSLQSLGAFHNVFRLPAFPNSQQSLCALLGGHLRSGFPEQL